MRSSIFFFLDITRCRLVGLDLDHYLFTRVRISRFCVAISNETSSIRIPGPSVIQPVLVAATFTSIARVHGHQKTQG